MKKAKKILFANFLACMVFGLGSAVTACGGAVSSDNGETSTPETSTPETSTPETSTPETWELEDVNVTYTVDKDGVEWVTYSVTANVGETYVKTVETGRKVEKILDFRLDDYEIYQEQIAYAIGVHKNSEIQINVMFDDNTTRWIPLTEEMICWGEYDLTKVGTYPIEVFCGAYAETVIFVVDYTTMETPTTTVFNNSGATLVWTQAEVESQTMYLPTMSWYHQSLLDEFSEPVKASEVAMVGTFTKDGLYDFVATNENGTEGYFSAYVYEDLANAEMSNTYSIQQTDTNRFYIPQDGTLAPNKFYITQAAIGYMATRAIPVTAEMIELDTSTAGQQTATVAYKEGEQVLARKQVSVFVYDSTQVDDYYNYRIDLLKYEPVESGIPIIAFSSTVKTTYLSGERELGTTYSYFSAIVTEDMLKNAPDFTTAGEKEITVVYNGKEYKTTVVLKDPNTTNVQSMQISSGNGELTSITVDKGADIAYKAKSILVGKRANVTYYKEVTGANGDVTITKEMLDWSEVDTSTAGEYVLYVRYKGYAKEITVIVNESPDEA